MSSAIALRLPRFFDYDYDPISAGSNAISHKWSQESNYLQGSALDWVPTVSALFRSIRNECSTANWDGQGAFAIGDQVIDIAEKAVEVLFELLPMGTPAPDVVPESDGEISISWSVDSSRMFSLSIGEHAKVNFAGQFGREGGVHAWQSIDTSSQSALEESLQDVAKYVGKLHTTNFIRRAA